MKKHKQDINIARKKLEYYKERKQKDDFDLKNKMTKYMANASFYRLKFETIDWLTNYLVGGQPLIWWLVIDIVGWLLILLAGQNIIATSELEPIVLMKVVGNCLSFPKKKKNQSSFGLLELKI
jgi:hypothetical protein